MVGCFHVVRRVSFGVRLRVAAVEMVGGADPPEGTERGAHVLVVARREDPATALAEPRDPLALGGRDPVASIQGEEPELVERRALERCEHWIVAVWPGFAVAPGNLEPDPRPERCEVLAQKRETLDRPVVRPGRRGRLDQNAYGAFHVVSLHERHSGCFVASFGRPATGVPRAGKPTRGADRARPPKWRHPAPTRRQEYYRPSFEGAFSTWPPNSNRIAESTRSGNRPRRASRTARRARRSGRGPAPPRRSPR